MSESSRCYLTLTHIFSRVEPVVVKSQLKLRSSFLECLRFSALLCWRNRAEQCVRTCLDMSCLCLLHGCSFINNQPQWQREAELKISLTRIMSFFKTVAAAHIVNILYYCFAKYISIHLLFGTFHHTRALYHIYSYLERSHISYPSFPLHSWPVVMQFSSRDQQLTGMCLRIPWKPNQLSSSTPKLSRCGQVTIYIVTLIVTCLSTCDWHIVSCLCSLRAPPQPCPPSLCQSPWSAECRAAWRASTTSWRTCSSGRTGSRACRYGSAQCQTGVTSFRL